MDVSALHPIPWRVVPNVMDSQVFAIVDANNNVVIATVMWEDVAQYVVESINSINEGN